MNLNFITKYLIEFLKLEDNKKIIQTENNQTIIVPTEQFKFLEDIICKRCTPAEIFYIAKLGLISSDVSKLGQAIIQSKNLKYNYLFARYIKGADIQGHAEVIINSKNLRCNRLFAENIPGANIEAHEAIILEAKDPKESLLFAKYVKRADIISHANIIIEKTNYSKKAYFISCMNELIQQFNEKNPFEAYAFSGYDGKGIPTKLIKIAKSTNSTIQNE